MTPPMSASAHATDPLQATRQWVETVVLGLKLCPFAKREVDAGRVRYVHSRATDADALLADPRRMRLFNRALALLLLGSLIPVLRS